MAVLSWLVTLTFPPYFYSDIKVNFLGGVIFLINCDNGEFDPH
jgi:hypothetical protein